MDAGTHQWSSHERLQCFFVTFRAIRLLSFSYQEVVFCVAIPHSSCLDLTLLELFEFILNES